MNFDFKREELSSVKCFASVNSEQSVDFELNLPDYCSDIKRILKCNIGTGINSVKRSGEEVSAFGETVLRLVYVNNDEKIDCYEHKTELSKTVVVKDLPEEAVLSCNCETEYVNCRAASQRRFSVNGSISVTFKAYCVEKASVVSEIKDGGAQTLKLSDSVVNSVSACEKCFDMSETASLEQSLEPIGKIIRADSYATLDSVKAVGGKLLLKGEMVTKVVYCADSAAGKIERFDHSMPISQIVELPEVTEESECSVRLCVRSLSLQPRADSTGSNRLLEIAAKVCAFVEARETRSVNFVTDCYSTCCGLKGEYSSVEVHKKVHSFNNSEIFRKTVELSGQSPKTVLDSRSLKSSCNVSSSGNGLELRLNVLVGVLFLDGEGKYQYAEREIDFSNEVALREKCRKVVCEPNVFVESVDAVAEGGERLNFSVTCFFLFDVFSAEAKRVCTTAVYDDSNPDDESALIVYYAKKGEKLWDIAKKYFSTVEAIKAENDLSSDETTEEKMLMIPRV